MPAPVLVHNYPADGDTDIPIGELITLYFDKGIDIETVKNSVILFGADSDILSGPDGARWIDNKRHTAPYYLKSPGFKGVAPIDMSFSYWDTTDTVDYAEVDPGDVASYSAESAGNLGHKVTIRLREGLMAPDTSYTLYVNGDTEATDQVGISARTIFDPVADPGNSSTTGDLRLYGTWEGTTDDTLNIKITTSGDIGTMKYKWWYSSLGEGSAVTQRVGARRYRLLDKGIQIRFTGSGYVANDLYTVSLSHTFRLATNSKIQFTTTDSTFVAAPAAPSVPASTSPPTSILPGISEQKLEVIKMTPRHTSYNNPNHTREIRIEFSDALDEDTITDANVILWAYPVDGHYSGTAAPKELSKEMTVSGSTLIIKF